MSCSCSVSLIGGDDGVCRECLAVKSHALDVVLEKLGDPAAMRERTGGGLAFVVLAVGEVVSCVCMIADYLRIRDGRARWREHHPLPGSEAEATEMLRRAGAARAERSELEAEEARQRAEGRCPNCGAETSPDVCQCGPDVWGRS